MAVNTFTFGGVTSSDFGIYVSGEGLFNAPKRLAEAVSIPGRNGDFILDQGKFENIKVTYRVFNQEKDLADFRSKLADLRSALMSQVGYQRLEDTFHPSEYRMAAFIDGVEIEPIKYNTAAEFEITFECKPQRFLKSGETAVSVTSGDTITNPTRFEAQPLLECYGYGDIQFNGFKISLENALMGDVEIVSNSQLSLVSYDSGNRQTVLSSVEIPVESFGNIGDSFNALVSTTFAGKVFGAKSISSASITSQPSTGQASITRSGTSVSVPMSGLQISGVTGTDTSVSYSCGTSITYISSVVPGSPSYTITNTITVQLDYNSATNTITATVSASGTTTLTSSNGTVGSLTSFVLDSTTPLLGNPTYADCEIGECYKIVDDVIVPLNAYIDLGSELPTLASGENEIIYDNTITQLDIVPRWWSV